MINSAGSDAIRLALGAVPMLILSLTIVGLLQGAGAIDLLQQLLKPLLSWLHIPQNFVLPALVKCVAGGTAYFGVISGADPAGQSHRGPGQRLGRSTDPDL